MLCRFLELQQHLGYSIPLVDLLVCCQVYTSRQNANPRRHIATRYRPDVILIVVVGHIINHADIPTPIHRVRPPQSMARPDVRVEMPMW